MKFIDGIIAQAKANRKRIVLPESTDSRILKAVAEIRKQGIADIILTGDSEATLEAAANLSVDLSGVEVVDPLKDSFKDAYAADFCELRKSKGVTLEQAIEQLKNPVYYAVMMVRAGRANGMVCGAVNSTANTLRPALQILRTAQGTKLVSTFFVMEVPDCELGNNGTFVFADCGLIENPDEAALAQIALASAESYRTLLRDEPRVAMLSFSTLGSAKGDMVDKVRRATCLVKEENPELAVEGELQLDAAIIPSVAALKAPNSQVAGRANVLIFPDLNSGNIGYKLVQRLAKAAAYGPITQGIAAPVNDLSRGCSAEDVVGVVAITAVQAGNR
ncbi:MAG: phosphate acetyltransferase [Clostridiaceae bacterium]|nr:phosphate acetyltransferase [Clostridiaceae bacterium]